MFYKANLIKTHLEGGFMRKTSKNRECEVYILYYIYLIWKKNNKKFLLKEILIKIKEKIKAELNLCIKQYVFVKFKF